MTCAQNPIPDISILWDVYLSPARWTDALLGKSEQKLDTMLSGEAQDQQKKINNS